MDGVNGTAPTASTAGKKLGGGAKGSKDEAPHQEATLGVTAKKSTNFADWYTQVREHAVFSVFGSFWNNSDYFPCIVQLVITTSASRGAPLNCFLLRPIFRLGGHLSVSQVLFRYRLLLSCFGRAASLRVAVSSVCFVISFVAWYTQPVPYLCGPLPECR